MSIMPVSYTHLDVYKRQIVSIAPEAGLLADEMIDCGGMYAMPGFIDAHMHFESTMLSPEALSLSLIHI